VLRDDGRPSSRRTSLLSDALDGAGRRNHCLGPDIVPLSGARLEGHAFPFVLGRLDRLAESPYRGLLAALDAVPASSVVVIPGGRSTDAALFGELMATAFLARGASGAICEGFVRDLVDVRALGFLLFGCGTVPYGIDGRLEVVGYGQPVEIDGVTIDPGGAGRRRRGRRRGRAAGREEAMLAAAAEKASKESEFRAAVAAGMPASEAYDRFDVL